MGSFVSVFEGTMSYSKGILLLEILEVVAFLIPTRIFDLGAAIEEILASFSEKAHERRVI